MVENNIFRLQRLANLSFGKVGVNHVLQHTSRLSLLPLLEFCQEHNIMIRVGDLVGANHLHVNGMTQGQHQQFLNDLLAARDQYKENFMTFSAVVYSLNFLSKYTFDREANKKFYDYINMIDSIRGTNYFEVFDEPDK